MIRRNILIFHLGALGDFVITWPLALALARVYPQSRVFYVTHGQKGKLAEKLLRVESLDVEAGWHALFSEPAKLPEPAARALAGAHTVLNLLANPDDAWVKNVAALSPGANLLTLTTQLPADYAGHVSEFLVGQLRPWPVIDTAARQLLRSVNDRGVSPSAGTPAGPVVIHPGSGSEQKNWPAEKFLALIDELKSAGRPVRVILGEVEAERWPAALIKKFESAAEVVRPATLLELASHLLSASTFVGNDSGPAHLAGALGVRTLALFGPDNAVRWKPLGPKVTVVVGGTQPLADLEVASVLGAL